MSDAKNAVLVLGDWFIDENWVVVQRESALSSRTGKDHYQLVGNRRSRVYSFCGAARVARLLWWRGRLDQEGAKLEELINDEQNPNSAAFRFHNDHAETFDITGVGRWAVGDDRRLLRLFLPGWSRGQNPFALTKPRTSGSTQQTRAAQPSMFDGLRLANLVTDDNVPSARVLRIYEANRSHVYGLQLRERFDVYGQDLRRTTSSQVSARNDLELDAFEAGIHDSHRRIDDLVSSMIRRLGPEHMTVDTQKVKEAVQAADHPSDRRRFAAAIIKDHGRGESDLIATILKRGTLPRTDAETHWFVTPRLWDPGDLTTLWKEDPRRGQLAVWLIGRLAIRNWSDSESDDHVPMPPQRWFAGKEPRAEAITALQAIRQSTGARYVIAVLGGVDFLAVSSVSYWWYCGKSGSNVIHLDLSGRESAILASLVAGLLPDPATKDPEALREIFANAMKDGEMYVCSQVTSLQKLGNIADKSYSPGKLSQGDVRVRELVDVDNLDPAKVVLGPRPATGQEPMIILSRASPDLDGYIELVPRRRRQVARLARELERFGASARSRGHLSALLIAGPGSGKTFLAKQLAKSSGLEFFELNLTHMSSPSALLDRFLTIVSFQNQAVGKRRALVFVDEVNARINSWPAYGQLLTVMSDGTFVSGGLTFKLDHCAWIFAGTDLLLTEEELRKIQERQPDPTTDGELYRAEQDITFAPFGPGWDLRSCLPDTTAWTRIKNTKPADHRSSKEPDFVSRLTLGRVVLSPRLDADERVIDEATRALRGVASIRRRYPHVTRIGRRALDKMRAFEGTARDLDRVIQQMTPPTETVTVNDLRLLPGRPIDDLELVVVRD